MVNAMGKDSLLVRGLRSVRNLHSHWPRRTDQGTRWSIGRRQAQRNATAQIGL